MAKDTFLCHLLCFLVIVIPFAFGNDSIATDQTALQALKSQIVWDSNSTRLLSNWTEETSVCSWIGVECSSLHDRVVALNFSKLGLRGTIPPHIGNLSFLTSLDFSHNNFQGQLPQEITNLRRLESIQFNVNNFIGEIPAWLGFLPILRNLDLRENGFSGGLPRSLFNATRLEFLRISSNLLNGNIPEDLGNLGNQLRILDMQYNQLEGSLPRSILNLSSLQVMAFTHNRLHGELPLDMCSMLPKLVGIYLPENQFTGELKSRLNNCSELQVLSLTDNNFTGSIPQEIGNLTKMVLFHTGINQFQGEIPSNMGNLLNLNVLYICENLLSGQIPRELGNLQRLIDLNIGTNNLSGLIPSSIFNMSSLSVISINFNKLTGSLPVNIGQQLPNLEKLFFGGNKLSGSIPNSISNLTKLTLLELANNRLTGLIPISLGNLGSLQRFSVFNNFLTTTSTTESKFLTSLTSCRNLKYLIFSGNPLNIQLFPGTWNFSNSLQYFDASSCQLRGNFPNEISNLTGLLSLSLEDNYLTGNLQVSIQKLSNLRRLSLFGNQISGFIPNSLCNMRHLIYLFINKNQFHGPIPQCFGNLTSLVSLHLENNEFNSTLPADIGNLRNLLEFDVHSNSLSGSITPTLGDLNAAFSINLSWNQFSGNIPSSIGDLVNLVNLSLAHNELHGPIPSTFGDLISLEYIDLSHNNLSGEIPEAFERLLALKYFNVSFNHFSGRIPLNGSFVNFTRESFTSNDALCGGPPKLHLPLCILDSSEKKSKIKLLRIVASVMAIIVALVILICGVFLLFAIKRKKVRTLAQVALTPVSMFERVSYYDIQQATNGFNESNLLGKGSFGTVYKAILRDGTILAIKVFNQKLERALRSFDIECEVLSNIRHRNLLKLISCCSNLDFKALVLEYMPNGSLERWLYSHNYCLDFLQRLNIMLDVASALEYLHHGYTSTIVHCDLKPSNVLIDEQMIGHVSDFGISKLIDGDDFMVQTMTLATIGYIAPEYGSEGLVSASCDVYSFGILLMETFSRRKPTDDMFVESWGLREMIMEGLQNSRIDIIDQNLLKNLETRESNKMIDCIVSIMKLALRCSTNTLEQRVDANVLLIELQKTKLVFLSTST